MCRISLVLMLSLVCSKASVYAQPIDAEVFKQRFEAARKDADVVAAVQVLSVGCSNVGGDERRKTATLQIALLVLENQRGTVARGDVLVVSHTLPLPTGPGPGLHDHLAALRQFPSTPGAKGVVALRWNQDARRYTPIAGWVPEPNHAAIPKELGQVFVWNDTSKLKKGMLREEVIKILGPPQKVDNTEPKGAVLLTYSDLILTFDMDRLREARIRLDQ